MNIEDHWHKGFDVITDPVSLLDTNYRILRVNKAYIDTFHLSKEKVIGKPCYKLIHKTNEPFPHCPFKLSSELKEIITREIYEPLLDLYLEITTYPLSDNRDDFKGMLHFMKNITARKRTEEATIQSEKRYRAVFDLSPMGIALLDAERKIVDCNNAFQKMLGYNLEELRGLPVAAISHPDDDRIVRDFTREMQEGRRDHFTTEKRHIRKNGTVMWGNLTGSVIRDEKNNPLFFFGILEDITERKKMEEVIRHQAHHDQLTGLPNRRFLLERLGSELLRAQRNPNKMALLYVDLDRFKNINDAFGHSAGDRLLEEVAERLRASVRESDVVARVGGDEFNILLTTMAHREDAAHVAEKVISLLGRPFSISGHELSISTSIGVSVYPLDGEHADVLLKHADIAMYYAKEQGRNNYQFYNSFMNTRTIERMILESSLRQTLDRGELVVYYQPQINAATNKIVCAEALVRWKHPEFGLLNPMEFIPLAEETGFIVSLDEWVLRAACEQIVVWGKEGYSSLRVTVNLSARQFQQPNLITIISQVLHDTGLSPDCLGIEITESISMQNVELTMSTLKLLHAMGITLSIDDFGKGYSSLSYLRKLPIIDPDISNLLSKPQGQAAVFEEGT